MNIYQKLSAAIEHVIFLPRVKLAINLVSYYVLPFSLALGATLGFVEYRDYVSLGSAAMVTLFVILFMKPLGVVFNIRLLRRALPYRRKMGVVMFWLAFFHAIGLIDPLAAMDPSRYTMTNYIMYGAIAMIGTGLLAITSNNLSLRLLRRNWKRLHYLAYPILIFVVVHADMAEGEWTKTAVVLPAFLILKVMEAKRVSIRLPIISA